MVVANASNAAAVSDALAERLGPAVVLDDRSLATALVAIQGPLASRSWRRSPTWPWRAALLRHRRGHVAGVPALVARTGYTGEDGFEIFVDMAAAGRVWDA
jgi:aminomethyltransferase